MHILLQCPSTKHIANDLVATLTTLLTHSHQPTWNSLTLYQQTSIMLADPPTTLPKKFHQTHYPPPHPHLAPRYPPPHPHLHSSPRNTLVQYTTRPATPLAQSPLCPPEQGEQTRTITTIFFSFFPVQSRDTEFSAAVHGGHFLCR